MACSNNLYRVATATHGGVTYDETTGGSINESVEFIENRPGTRKSPCIAIQSYGCEAEVEFQGMATPETQGAKATLTYTLENFANATGSTVAVANMRAGGSSFDFNSGPYKQRAKLRYDAADAEDMQPITVSV